MNNYQFYKFKNYVKVKMVQCKKCKLFLSLAKDDIVKCKGECENVYHEKCATKKFLGTTLCDDCQTNKSSPKHLYKYRFKSQF